MKNIFKLTLICNEKKIFDDNVCEVRVKRNDEDITILAEHQPYMAEINKLISYTEENDSPKTIEFESGFFYTNGHHLFVVIDN
ncbi:MAG: hypothetical protein LBF70_02450 [Holosporales bacterium]|jgi:F0F1-type ATP synthase epsilon subunit|nr:hypothetical protein [Holosporales bacterium]